MGERNQEDVQRWTTKRKAALVLSLLKGETSIQEAARQHGLTVAELEEWKERFLLAAENALRARPKDEDARAKHPGRSPELVELATRARLQTSMSAFDVLTPPNPDYMKLASSINVPTLLIIAENGVVSRAMAAKQKLANHRFKVEHIRNAAHGVHYDQPERFAVVVRSFLHSIG